MHKMCSDNKSQNCTNCGKPKDEHTAIGWNALTCDKEGFGKQYSLHNKSYKNKEVKNG
jgi:hypothetical protein